MSPLKPGDTAEPGLYLVVTGQGRYMRWLAGTIPPESPEEGKQYLPFGAIPACTYTQPGRPTDSQEAVKADLQRRAGRRMAGMDAAIRRALKGRKT